jgi:hypothetical protein
MNLTHTLPLAALIASVYLLFGASARLPAIAAVLASGFELLLSSGTITLHRSAPSTGLILGLVLGIAGIFCYLRVSAKIAVAASTVVALVGIIQVLFNLHMLQG